MSSPFGTCTSTGAVPNLAHTPPSAGTHRRVSAGSVQKLRYIQGGLLGGSGRVTKWKAAQAGAPGRDTGLGRGRDGQARTASGATSLERRSPVTVSKTCTSPGSVVTYTMSPRLTRSLAETRTMMFDGVPSTSHEP